MFCVLFLATASQELRGKLVFRYIMLYSSNRQHYVYI